MNLELEQTTKQRIVVLVNYKARKLVKKSPENADIFIHNQVIQNINTSVYDVIQYDFQDEHWQKELKDNDIVAIIGGDGSINGVVNALYNTGKNEHTPNNVTLLPLGFGGANDTATSIYNRANDNIADILQHSAIAKATAITAIIERSQEDNTLTTITVQALGYIGVGASGAGAHEIDQTREKTKNVARILGRMVLRLIQQRPFSLKQHKNSKTGDEKDIKLYELLALNGRMAMALYPDTIHIFENAFHLLRIRKNIMGLGTLALSLSRGAAGEMFTGDESFTFTVTSSANTLYLNADGEVVELLPNDTVTIQNGPELTMLKLTA